jgi:hydrogenase nickel incorporation protein HypA/HybF
VHELSIAQSLIEVVVEQLALNGFEDDKSCAVAVVHARIGVRSAVIPAALQSAFSSAVRGTPLRRARLCIEMVPAGGWCGTCEEERVLEDPRKLRCPSCGERMRRLTRGNELEVSCVELFDRDVEEPLHAAANSGSTPANS